MSEDLIRDMSGGDVPTVVDLHVSAMPDFFLTFLGQRFLRLYYTRLIADTSSIAKVSVADDGTVNGAVVGSTNPAGFYGRLLRKGWWSFGWAAIPAVIRSPRVIARLLRALRFPSEQPEGLSMAGLYSITVHPDHQGRGVGRGLVEAFLLSVRDAGSESVYLHADAVGNDGWNRLLQTMGWQLRREFTTPEGRPMNEYWYDLGRSAHE